MTNIATPIPIPTLAPFESVSFDAAGVDVVDGDVVGKLGAELTAFGLGGRLSAAPAGHAAAVLVRVYFAELMLEGEAVAMWLDTF